MWFLNHRVTLQNSSQTFPPLLVLPHPKTFMILICPYFTQCHFSHLLQCVQRLTYSSGYGQQHKGLLGLKIIHSQWKVSSLIQLSHLEGSWLRAKGPSIASQVWEGLRMSSTLTLHWLYPWEIQFSSLGTTNWYNKGTQKSRLSK